MKLRYCLLLVGVLANACQTRSPETQYPTASAATKPDTIASRPLVLRDIKTLHGAHYTLRLCNASPGWYLLLRDNSTQHMDTLAFDAEEASPDFPEHLVLEDLADSLHSKTPMPALNYTGSSDMPYTELFTYQQGKLQHLVQIPELMTLRRVNDTTLEGSAYSYEETLGCKYECPFRLSLVSRKFAFTEGTRVYLNWDTQTLEDITGRRLPNHTPYTIHKGADITVDSLYRDAGRALVRVRDSVKIEVRVDALGNAVAHDPAG